MTQENKCRRCLKSIEKTKSCGEVDCLGFNARDIWKPTIKKDWEIDLADKYFIRNLCNNCEDLMEKVLTTFNNCKIVVRSIEELEKESGGKFTYKIDGGQEGEHTHDGNTQIIKVWEDDKVWKFDLKSQSIENVLNSMNF